MHVVYILNIIHFILAAKSGIFTVFASFALWSWWTCFIDRTTHHISVAIITCKPSSTPVSSFHILFACRNCTSNLSKYEKMSKLQIHFQIIINSSIIQSTGEKSYLLCTSPYELGKMSHDVISANSFIDTENLFFSSKICRA